MNELFKNQYFKIWTTSDEEKTAVLDFCTKQGMCWGDGVLANKHTFETPLGIHIRNGVLTKSTRFNYFVSCVDATSITLDDLQAIENGTIETIICNACGETTLKLNSQEFENKHYCNTCLNYVTTVCEICGERIWRSDNAGSRYTPLCESCRQEHYIYCDNCGDLTHRNNSYYLDGAYYCCSCYNDKIECINSYNYKPNPIFYGKDRFYFGVELEVDEGGENNENAHKLIEIMNDGNEKIYCKHDGSLRNGFEIVSHPATLEEHTNNFNWFDLMEKAIEMEYQSHNAGTCGLHIHVNRKAFGKDEKSQDRHIQKIVYFVEKHWNNLKILSRRTDGQLSEWANRYGIERTAKQTYDKAKGNSWRYSAVNLLPTNTIEFRFFRGTLKYDTFLATLQLVYHICNYCLKNTIKTVEIATWSDFVKVITEPQLINYLKEKDLYL